MYKDENNGSAQNLSPCKVCGRSFNQQSLQRHEKICKKASTKQRKVFDSAKHRAEGTDIKLPRNRPKPGEVAKHQPIPRSNWRQNHANFVSAIRSARGAQVAMAAGKPLPPPPPPTINPDYVQCPHCGRRFNESAAERHINFCKEQQNRVPSKKSAPAAASRVQAARTQFQTPKPKSKQPAGGGGVGNDMDLYGAQSGGRYPGTTAMSGGGYGEYPGSANMGGGGYGGYSGDAAMSRGGGEAGYPGMSAMISRSGRSGGSSSGAPAKRGGAKSGGRGGGNPGASAMGGGGGYPGSSAMGGRNSGYPGAASMGGGGGYPGASAMGGRNNGYPGVASMGGGGGYPGAAAMGGGLDDFGGSGRALRTGRTAETYSEARELSANQRANMPAKRGGIGAKPTAKSSGSHLNPVVSGGGGGYSCHDCGSSFPNPQARFCCECGVKRI